MNIYETITLLAIMTVLAAIPGASVALVVARTATAGLANGLAVAAGIVLGDLVFMVFAVFGLSVVAEKMGSLFILVRVLGGAYLVWFGYSLWTKNTVAYNTENANSNHGSLLASFMAGLILTLGDIKAIIFYASLLPVFINISAIQATDIVLLVLITVVSVGGVKVVYVIFANKAAAYAQKKRLAVVARRTAAGLMVGAGGYLIVKA